ncbi:glycerol kinase GlpK [Humisphaera borealis]|uniref:Glycerol kinase n=1 Tax=Humisphaera borealis TaxID=2807512 RepID=A0A7M2WQZ4_9BACT|nr:glycerol kinase GlpK [Humisphaera borealis]QOV87572.1 glycerol kinase GlpK [Humisphaera borealis]
MPRLIAAIDQGTTSSRCILFDASGSPVSVSQLEHRQIYPRPGWVEHDALEIWRRVSDVIHGAMSRANATAADIAGVGITNQRETTVVWDRRTGLPLTHAIVWQDTRTRDLCNELSADGGQNRFRQQTGLPMATYFSGPKLRWMLENVDGLRDAAEQGDALFGTIDSWLIWHLTGGPDGGAHVTDVTNAGRTMLMDLASLDWDDELLKVMRVPRQMLPRIVPSLDRASWGMTRRDGPFGGEIPVCGCLGDQHAAMLGQTCFTPGESKNTYGTGCFMLLHTGEKPVVSTRGLLTTLAYKLGDEPACYALEGSVAVAGSLVQWVRDNLGMIADSTEIESLARSVPDNGDVYFVPAFAGLFAPHWRSDARGTIVGLTGFANKGHIARAVLEATAFQTLDVLDAMRQDCGLDLKVLRVDGGMAANELLMQFQADLLGVPVVRPVVTETTALGAAYAAGLATGFWKNTDDLQRNWRAAKQWEPQMKSSDRRRLHERWKQAVERSLGWER